MPLGLACDVTLLVVRPGAEAPADVAMAARALRRAGVTVGGLVLNDEDLGLAARMAYALT